MNRSRVGWLLLLWVYLAVAACTPRLSAEAMCEYLSEPELMPLPNEVLDRSQLPGWVQATYGLDASEITTTEYEPDDDSGQAYSLGWKREGKAYLARYSKEDLLNVYVVWEELIPTADDIQRCLGEPEWYGAYWTQVPAGPLFEFELWYPSKGISAEAVAPGRWRGRPEINGKLAMYRLVVVPPGTQEEVVQQVFATRAVGVQEDALRTLRPWPRSWAEIEVTEEARR